MRYCSANIRPRAVSVLCGFVLTFLSAWLIEAWAPSVRRMNDYPTELRLLPLSRGRLGIDTSYTLWRGFGRTHIELRERMFALYDTGPWKVSRVVVSGFPFPAIMRVAPAIGTYGVSERTRAHSGTGLRQGLAIFVGGHRRQLPLVPCMPMFLLNAIYWTAVVECIARSATSIITHSRRRQGRCRSCGYSMFGLVQCPECGSRPAERSAISAVGATGHQVTRAT